MTTIIIPMAGLSSRFYNAGFNDPKYKLSVGDKTVFYYSLKGFNSFKNCLFLIIGIKGVLDVNFVKSELRSLGVHNYDIILLDHPTNGQAETVFNGLKKASDKNIKDILIFNIDTFRRDIEFPKTFDLRNCSGYLETFVGSGKNWSNILPSTLEPHSVSFTAEKQSISEYCCTGLYYFSDYLFFNEAYCQWIEKHKNQSEVYIAPLYNYLIENKHNINFTVIDDSDVVFCGVPSEYERIKNGFSWV